MCGLVSLRAATGGSRGGRQLASKQNKTPTSEYLAPSFQSSEKKKKRGEEGAPALCWVEVQKIKSSPYIHHSNPMACEFDES